MRPPLFFWSLIVFVVSVVSFGLVLKVEASACQSNATGNWSAAGTWTNCGGGTPQTSDTVEILNSHTVTLNTSTTTATLTIDAGGTLVADANSRTLTLGGTTGTLFTLATGGTFTPSDSTIEMNPDAAVTLTDGTITFNNLVLDPLITANRAYTFGGGAITINNNLIITTASSSAAAVLTVNQGAAITVAATGQTLIGGNGSATSVLATNNYALTPGNLKIGYGGNLLTYNSSGVQNDYAQAITIDADKNIYVAGYQQTNGYDLVVRKYDTYGVLCDGLGSCPAWGEGSTGTVTYNSSGTQSDKAWAITIDASKNIYVAGEQGGDWVILKYDASGVLDTTWGTNGVISPGTSSQIAYAITIDTDKNIYVTGIGYELGGPGTNWAIRKYDSDGVLDTTWGSSGVITYSPNTMSYQNPFAITIDADKSIYVGGDISTNSGDLAVRKYDADGVLDATWGTGGMVTYNSGANDRAYAITTDADKNVYVAGRKFQTGINSTDWAIIKYNSSGATTTTWGTGTSGMVTYSPSGSQRDAATAITIDADKNIYVAGYQQTNEYDWAVLKYDSAGALDTTWGTNGIITFNSSDTKDDAATAITIDADKNIYVAGYQRTSNYNWLVQTYDANGDNNYLWPVPNTGTLSAGSSLITLAGNYWNHGLFTAGTSNFTVASSSPQTLYGNATSTSAFYDLTLNNSSGAAPTDGEITGWSPGVIFTDSASSTGTYTITTAGTKVQYKSGASYSFNNINWNGQAAGTPIYFRNSAASGLWNLIVTGVQTAVSYLDVSRSDASDGNEIITLGSTDSGNNTNWTFDSTAPVRSAGSPANSLDADIGQTTLSLTTNETATCKYGSTANVAYASMANTFSTTGSVSHSQTLANLQSGATYTYYVRCLDSFNNANTDDYTITFSLASAPSGGSTARARQGRLIEQTSSTFPPAVAVTLPPVVAISPVIIPPPPTIQPIPPPQQVSLVAKAVAAAPALATKFLAWLTKSKNLEFPIVDQKVFLPAATTITLAFKPEAPTKQITGYLVLSQLTANAEQHLTYFKLSPSQKIKQLAALAALDLTAGKEIENRLVLDRFVYQDSDQDGIYTANIITPTVAGAYEIITVLEYEAVDLGKKELRLTIVVDPEGYVYERIKGNDLRLTNATVTLYVEDLATKKFKVWPAAQYQQKNPQITDRRGAYSFLVPSGNYYLTVTAASYRNYQSRVFSIATGQGIHQVVEMKKKSFWRRFIDWLIEKW